MTELVQRLRRLLYLILLDLLLRHFDHHTIIINLTLEGWRTLEISFGIHALEAQPDFDQVMTGMGVDPERKFPKERFHRTKRRI